MLCVHNPSPNKLEFSSLKLFEDACRWSFICLSLLQFYEQQWKRQITSYSVIVQLGEQKSKMETLSQCSLLCIMQKLIQVLKNSLFVVGTGTFNHLYCPVQDVEVHVSDCVFQLKF